MKFTIWEWVCTFSLKPDKIVVKRSTSFSIIGRFGLLPLYLILGLRLCFMDYFLTHIIGFLATGKVELLIVDFNKNAKIVSDMVHNGFDQEKLTDIMTVDFTVVKAGHFGG
jgi:hypothetical protein